jgi:hypothetical protein
MINIVLILILIFFWEYIYIHIYITPQITHTNNQTINQKLNKKFARSKPSFPKGLNTVRVTVMGPEWAKKGYSEEDPGLAFWATTSISPRSNVPPPSPPLPEPGQPPSVPGAVSGVWTAQAFPRLGRLPDGAAAKVFYGTQILKAIQDGSIYPGEGAPPVMTMTSVKNKKC